MRFAKDHKEKTRGEIIEATSRLMREKGVDSVSVADVMKATGRTVGGFYHHFSTKEELVATSLKESFNEAHELITSNTIKDKTDASKVEGLITRYLSKQHRDTPSHGCTIAALSTDISRLSPEVRKQFSPLIDKWIASYQEVAETDEDTALLLVSAMVGAMQLSRMHGVKSKSDELLDRMKGILIEMMNSKRS